MYLLVFFKHKFAIYVFREKKPKYNESIITCALTSSRPFIIINPYLVGRGVRRPSRHCNSWNYRRLKLFFFFFWKIVLLFILLAVFRALSFSFVRKSASPEKTLPIITIGLRVPYTITRFVAETCAVSPKLSTRQYVVWYGKLNGNPPCPSLLPHRTGG